MSRKDENEQSVGSSAMDCIFLSCVPACLVSLSTCIAGA